MISKQILLGSVLLIGGAVAMFAATQNKGADNTATQNTADTKQQSVARPVAVPLTADVATEEKLLAQKQKEREAHNNQMAKEAEALLSEQEKARMLALEKAKREANPNSVDTPISADNASQSELIAVPAVQTRPEAAAAARAAEEKKAQERQLAEQSKKDNQTKADNKSDNKSTNKPEKTAKPEPKPVQKTDAKTKTGEHKVTAGDNLTRLSRQYGVSVAAIAAANNMGRGDALVSGRTIKIPTAAQAAKLEQESQNKQTAQNKQNTQSKLAESTKPAAKTDSQAKEKTSEKKPTGATYSVQVSISPDKAKVDDIVKKYRAAGYQVSTSQTSRGTRVLVGSAKSYDEANALKQKIAQDSRVDSSGAWVKKMEQ
ncbi:MAG: LysM peptidoglycan-binding domain-containing protein [Moraxella sp.]|nr:LysM peptidoglycan-binding domain-containing protein [Moraxella sp.]